MRPSASSRQSWNSAIYVSFAITLAATFSYIPIFARIPSTRDVPWVNFLLYLTGGWLLAVGLKRAYGESERYSGKIGGAVVCALSLALFGIFCWGNFVFARRLPSGSYAPQAGDAAPDFTLADSDGRRVTLTELRRNNRAVLLIFYRGHASPFCNSELRSFEKRLADFRARHVQIVAISADSSAESHKLREDKGYSFLFLSDPTAQVIRSYGVLHPGSGDGGRDIARPAEFLVDVAGSVRWVNLTDDLRVRARPQIVLEAIDYLQLPTLSYRGFRNPAEALPSSTTSYSPAFQSHTASANFTVRRASFPATTKTM